MSAPSRKVYVGSRVVFVPHPDNPRFYYKGHISMGFVECPHCGAPPMKPCIHTNGEVMASDGHYHRRHAYQDMLKNAAEKLAKTVHKTMVTPPRPGRVTEFPVHEFPVHLLGLEEEP